MVTAEQLRDRARSWRIAADTTRREAVVLGGVADLSWRAPSAGEFRRLIGVRVRELQDLAAREDDVAALLERVAGEVEGAA